jgi:hypothetical protein
MEDAVLCPLEPFRTLGKAATARPTSSLLGTPERSHSLRRGGSSEKGRHEPPAGRVAAKFGAIDDTGERLSRNHAAKRGAHLGGNRHVRMTTAEHHDRIAGGAAVGAGAQCRPHAERIDDRSPCADIEQPLDKTFGRIGLARAGRADDCDPVIESFGGKSRIAIVQSLPCRLIDIRLLFTFYSSTYSRKPSPLPVIGSENRPGRDAHPRGMVHGGRRDCARQPPTLSRNRFHRVDPLTRR